jgi:hypothetical protein
MTMQTLDPPRVIITGDRRWECTLIASAVMNSLVERYGIDFTVVHGAASGVDTVFARACERRGVKHEPHPAAWDVLDAPGAVIRQREDGRSYNANAGPSRNAEMVAGGAAFAIAVHRNLAWSKGTRDCVGKCLRAQIPVYLVDGTNPPRRIRAI